MLVKEEDHRQMNGSTLGDASNLNQDLIPLVTETLPGRSQTPQVRSRGRGKPRK